MAVRTVGRRRQRIGIPPGTRQCDRVGWSGGQNTRPVRMSIAANSSNGERVDLQMPVESRVRAPNPVRSGYVVWWRNTMQKIYPTEFPPSKGGAATISLASNEREGFQLAVTPADDVVLHDVTISVGPLLNERGDVFPPQAIEQHLVGYIYVETPSSHPRGAGPAQLVSRGAPARAAVRRARWPNANGLDQLPRRREFVTGNLPRKGDGATDRDAGRELPLSVRVARLTLPHRRA